MKPLEGNPTDLPEGSKDELKEHLLTLQEVAESRDDLIARGEILATLAAIKTPEQRARAYQVIGTILNDWLKADKRRADLERLFNEDEAA